jgi:DNA-binding IclR family transcriptional regulator
MVQRPFKAPPPYAVTSVDNALRVATMLQLEGPVTITQVAQRLGVAASTAHRLLAMLVYRDFAVRGFDRTYRAGPVLEVAAHSCSNLPRLREVALPHLHHLAETVDETVSLGIRTGNTVRFAASVEARQPIRVGSREGMAFAAHRASAGLVLLADLTGDEVGAVYDPQEYADPLDPPPTLSALLSDLATVRRNGFAFNKERSEKGVIAVGAPVRGPAGVAIAAIAVSMLSARYHKNRLPWLVALLKTTAARVESDLATAGVG